MRMLFDETMATTDNSTLEVNIILEIEEDNSTSKDTFLFHGYRLVVPLSIFMFAFMILAIGGNVMVILTIVRHRGMRTRTNMFIINLAIADILVAFLDMPFSLATVLEGDWIFGHGMCQFNGFTMALLLICSIHTLMYISIHKFISITKPFSRAMTPRRIKMMLAAAWMWAIICASGPLIGWNSIGYKMGASQCGPNVPKRDNVLDMSHSLFITTTNYLIPLGVMTFCYWRIFKEIHVHMDRIRETSNINLSSSVQQQRKVSITLLLVLACFVICWTPFVIYSTTLAMLKDKTRMPLYINPLAYWFGYMNSACNPIIYAFRSPSFRQGYKEIMCGSPAPGLSGVHSLSFRSRSARGSLKSNPANSQVVSSSSSLKKCKIEKGQMDDKRKRRGGRKKRMLAQTSWMSLPIIPFLRRSFSSAPGTPPQSVKDRSKDEEQSPQRRGNVAQWGHCMCCSSDMSNDEATEDEGGKYDRKESKPESNEIELNVLSDAEGDRCLTDDNDSDQNLDTEDGDANKDQFYCEVSERKLSNTERECL